MRVAPLRPPGLRLTRCLSEPESSTVARERRRVSLACECAIAELTCVLGARLGGLEEAMERLESGLQELRARPAPEAKEGPVPKRTVGRPEVFVISGVLSDADADVDLEANGEPDSEQSPAKPSTAPGPAPPGPVAPPSCRQRRFRRVADAEGTPDPNLVEQNQEHEHEEQSVIAKELFAAEAEGIKNIIQEVVKQVPMIQQVEKIIEVPQIQVVEKIVEIPEVQIQEVVKHVPKIQVVEKIIEMPRIQLIEKIVEVPEVQIKEVVKHVPKIITQEVVKNVPVVQVQIVEKLVEVPQVKLVEKIVEVPEVQIQEVVKEVPKIVLQQAAKGAPWAQKQEKGKSHVQTVKLLNANQRWTACGPDHDEGWATHHDNSVCGQQRIQYYEGMIQAARDDFPKAGIAEGYRDSLIMLQVNIEELARGKSRDRLTASLNSLRRDFEQRCEHQEVMRRFKQ